MPKQQFKIDIDHGEIIKWRETVKVDPPEIALGAVDIHFPDGTIVHGTVTEVVTFPSRFAGRTDGKITITSFHEKGFDKLKIPAWKSFLRRIGKAISGD